MSVFDTLFLLYVGVPAICVLVFVLLCHRHVRRQRARLCELSKMVDSVEEDVRELRECGSVFRSSLRSSYVLFGEILHSFNCYVQEGKFKYAGLINQIGQIVRAAHGENYEWNLKNFNPKGYGLSDPDAEIFSAWYGSFVERGGDPEELLLLVHNLMFSGCVQDALTRTDLDLMRNGKL